MKWKVPNYAPDGEYRAKFQVMGYINRDDNIEVIETNLDGDEEFDYESEGSLK